MLLQTLKRLMVDTSDVIKALYKQYLLYPSISTDSRSVTLNAIFFALKGPNFDGNAFAAQALAKGAACAVIDDIQYKQDERYILVDDVLKALQELASFHRKQLKIPIIAITGSNGKTTTKELTQAVLSQQYKSYATQGNLNNHIGVPCSLLAMNQSVEIAVIEMGASHIGDIAQLCAIAMPTHGLITSIGHAHLEGFGSLEGVIKGKSELYDYLLRHSGQVFINSTDPILSNIGKRLDAPIYYYPQRQGFYHCELVKEDPYVVYKSNNGQIVSTQLLGKHHFNNIAAALCIAKYFRVDESSANQAIQAYQPYSNRSQVIKKGSNIILLDSYNANPESVKGAIRAFQLIQATHKVLILGNMSELGEDSLRFHQELVELTTQGAYQEIILCGPHLEAAQANNSKALFFKQKSDLEAYLKHINFENTAILIKGSRILQLETLVELINSTNR
ncbi:MAG: UDP-N-acetylmuramoyl-tripeptide--D-alanyl-D-alanine ligase [Bacteroidota bacterium]